MVMRENMHLVAAVAAALIVTVVTGCGGSALTKQADAGGGYLPVTVTVVQVAGWDVTLSSSEELQSVVLYFKDGTSASYTLSGYVETVHSNSGSEMTYLKAGTKSGDYWYFDRSGNWLPNGYSPKFWSSLAGPGKSTNAVWIGGTQLQISSSDTYSEVKVGYADGSIDTYVTSATSGSYDLRLSPDNLEAVRITLQSDGSKWYFDAQGNTLPAGSKWYADLD